MLIIPHKIAREVFNATKKVLKELGKSEYKKYLEEHRSLLPGQFDLIKKIPSTGPETYILDWALIKKDKEYSLALIELNQGIQENLTVVYWTRAFLSSIGMDFDDRYFPCCENEDEYLLALKKASKDRIVLWLSYMGHECQLYRQYYGNELVNPWDLRISGERLTTNNREIKKILSFYYYPCCIKALHQKSLDCINGSVLDHASLDTFIHLNTDWWPSFHGFYQYSKFSLPYLSQKLPELVPESYFLKDFNGDIDRFILKPLFLYSAIEFEYNPTERDLETAPEASVVMRKVDYSPAVLVPTDSNEKSEKRKLEIRCYALRNANGAIKMHCGYSRLMKPFICMAQPGYNQYPFGGELHTICFKT